MVTPESFPFQLSMIITLCAFLSEPKTFSTKNQCTSNMAYATLQYPY